MTAPDLSSPEARRCLWPCHSFLLRLAEEAERNTAADSEVYKGHESAAATEATELTRQDNDTPEAEPGQIEVEAAERARSCTPNFVLDENTSL